MRRFRRRARRQWPAFLVALLLLAVTGGWLGWQAWQLQHALTQARSAVSDLEQAVRGGHLADAPALLQRVQQPSHQAGQVSRDPVWRLASHVPVLGANLAVGGGLAQAVDDLATDVLPGTIQGALLLTSARTPDRSAVDVAAFGSAAGQLRRSADAAVAVQTRLRALGDDSVLAPLSTARETLTARVDGLTTTLAGAALAAETVPALLGSHSPQRYFLALQNNAESRGSGGLTAAFGIIAADRGALTLTRTGVNDELREPATAPLDLGRDFAARYGRSQATRSWLNANESPDFPTTGRILTSLWNATEAQPVDGVVAIDPVAISYVLQATGPVTLQDGTSVTAANVVDLTLRQLYERYPDDASTSGRTRFLQELVRQAFDQASRAPRNPAALAERLGRAVLEGHLQVYSNHPDLQRRLETTRIAGALPAGTPNVLQVVTQNLAGGKLDYYLRRDIRYTATGTGRAVDIGDGAGPQIEQAGQLTLTLTNTAPASGLPTYVTKRADLPAGTKYPAGRNRLWVSVYLGRGAQLDTATVNGKPVSMSSERERGLNVFSTVVEIDPGASVVLRLGVFQPTPGGAILTYRSQPLAVPDQVELTAPR